MWAYMCVLACTGTCVGSSELVCVCFSIFVYVCVCIRGLFNKCEYQDIVVKDKSVTTYFITNN